MKKLFLSILAICCLLSANAYAKEVRIICYNDDVIGEFRLAQIDEAKKKFYWNDYLYEIIDLKTGLIKDKGSIVGFREGEFIKINRYTYKASVQKDELFKNYSCKKEKKLF